MSANASAMGHYSTFAGHRERLTAMVAAAAAAGGGSLCVLGAGNCFDLELDTLAQHFAEIHLVDIDDAALTRAVSRQDAAVRTRLTTHAPVDLSGMLSALERWSRFELTPDELIEHSERTARDVRSRLGRTFDVVVSACLLSQMQLNLVHGLGDGHALMQVVSWTLTVAHFSTLAALTTPGGKAIFATDLTADPIFPLANQYAAKEALELVDTTTRAGKVFDFANPDRLRAMLEDNPLLQRAFPVWSISDAWVWTNGPALKFLVYGAVLPRRRE